MASGSRFFGGYRLMFLFAYTSSRVVRALVVSSVLTLVGCGGGASSNGSGASFAPPQPTQTPSSNSSFAPTSIPLSVSTFSPSQTVDPIDSHPVPLALGNSVPVQVLQAQRGVAHLVPLYTSGTPPPALVVSADRRSLSVRKPSTDYIAYPADPLQRRRRRWRHGFACSLHRLSELLLG